MGSSLHSEEPTNGLLLAHIAGGKVRLRAKRTPSANETYKKKKLKLKKRIR